MPRNQGSPARGGNCNPPWGCRAPVSIFSMRFLHPKIHPKSKSSQKVPKPYKLRPKVPPELDFRAFWGP